MYTRQLPLTKLVVQDASWDLTLSGLADSGLRSPSTVTEEDKVKYSRT